MTTIPRLCRCGCHRRPRPYAPCPGPPRPRGHKKGCGDDRIDCLPSRRRTLYRSIVLNKGLAMTRRPPARQSLHYIALDGLVALEVGMDKGRPDGRLTVGVDVPGQ